MIQKTTHHNFVNKTELGSEHQLAHGVRLIHIGQFEIYINLITRYVSYE